VSGRVEPDPDERARRSRQANDLSGSCQNHFAFKIEYPTHRFALSFTTNRTNHTNAESTVFLFVSFVLFVVKPLLIQPRFHGL
jgi:hypothetical protein